MRALVDCYRRMPDVFWGTGIGLTPVFIAIGIWVYWQVTTSHLTIHNLTPYDVRFAWQHPTSDSEDQVEGWVALSPGETWTTSFRFKDCPPRFAVSGETASPSLVRLVHQVPYGETATLYFDGGAGSEAFWRELPFGFGESFTASRTDLRRSRREPKQLLFSPVRAAGSDRNFVHAFRDELQVDIDSIAIDDQQALAETKAHLHKIRRSLERYVKMERLWMGYQFPVDLQQRCQKQNALTEQGLTVIGSGNGNSTYHGDGRYESPVREGDVLLYVNSTPVFHAWDVRSALLAHARDLDRGIEVPIELGFARYGSEFKCTTTYRFNPLAYPQDNVSGSAGLQGAWSSATLGLDEYATPVIKNAGKAVYNLARWAFNATETTERAEYVDLEQERWRIVQRSARLKQFHRDSFEGGEILGMFVSPGNLLRGSIVKGGRKSLLRNAAELAVIASAEATVYTLAEGDYDRTAEQRYVDLVNNVSAAGAIGFTFGILTRGR